MFEGLYLLVGALWTTIGLFSNLHPNNWPCLNKPNRLWSSVERIQNNNRLKMSYIKNYRYFIYFNCNCVILFFAQRMLIPVTNFSRFSQAVVKICHVIIRYCNESTILFKM